MALQTKRQNFNITPEQEAELAWLREALDAPTTKDTILRAVRVTAALSREARRGYALYLHDRDGHAHRLVIPDLEPVSDDGWQYLVARAHPWRRQMAVKGRRVLASEVWSDMVANGDTPEQAASNWGLPPDAVCEIVRYCEANRDLIAVEAEEDAARVRAEAAGGVASAR
jgi:hypothetical protein